MDAATLAARLVTGPRYTPSVCHGPQMATVMASPVWRFTNRVPSSGLKTAPANSTPGRSR